MVQWLGLRALNAGGVGMIPSQGTRIPYAAQCNHKVKNKRADIFKKRQGKFANKDTNVERTTQRHRKKMATYKSGREAWNRPFPYSPLEESTLLTP